MENKTESMPKLKQQLESQKKANAEQFKIELEALKQKYECEVIPIISIVGTNIKSVISIEPY